MLCLSKRKGLVQSDILYAVIIFLKLKFVCCVQRICDKVYGIHKIHGNYGRVFSEWSAIEKEMADGLQSAGHYMDV